MAVPCAIDVSIAQPTLALLSLTALASRTSTVLPLAETFADAGPGSATRAASKPIPEPTPLVPAAVDRWRPAAQELVRSGVTQKDPNVVARILAEHAAGTPPTTIGKKLDVHHETVNRIVARANELAV